MSLYFDPAIIPTQYATASDLAAWTQAPAPANADQILRACTGLVLDATEEAYYTTDPTTGMATDTQILGAMRDATCIQAAAWIALNIDPATGGVLTQSLRTSKKIGTAQVTFDVADTAAAAAARQAAYTGLVPAALAHLRRYNLIGNGPYAL